VAKRSGERIGYIHVPDFGANGVGEFLRQLEAQIDKDALLIDVRWSLGGSQGLTVAEFLARRPMNYTADRYAPEVWPVPRRGAHFGPTAVLVNHLVHSAGENFLYYYRKLGLGPIIGTRTWGGLVGLNGNPALIDNGYVNVPNAPFFDASGWLIEGHGVEPDQEIEPARQLETAVDLLLREITTRPYEPPRAPPPRQR
jgi:tricorn protease